MTGHAAQDLLDEDKTALLRLLHLPAVIYPSKPGEKLLTAWMRVHDLAPKQHATEAEREAEWLARDKYWFMADGPDAPEQEDASDG